MDMKMPFLLTTISGLSTLIGFLIIFIFKKNNYKILICCLSFSAGVLLMMSFSELIFESLNFLKNNKYQLLICVASIIIGMFISYGTNKLLPDNTEKFGKIYKVGILSLISIVIHNIPEGIITFMTTNYNISLGISLTIGIIMHNIPEGIIIAMPIYYSTKSVMKAFLFTLISGSSELLGGLLAYLFLMPYINDLILGIFYSIIAGIMIYISIFELLPVALNYNKRYLTLLFFLLGVIFILVKL